ncbi:DUF4270 domain-containing protein [Labilibacter sediminis]|nr:DUF4270 domain-containing protein [Labilibacter sediminis]
MRTQQVSILAFVILLFSACKDDASEIGGGLFPENEIIDAEEYIATHEKGDIRTSNVKSDAIEFSTIKSFIIGEFDDPFFGKTTADFLSQVSLGQRGTADTTTIKINDNYELDSTRLLIKYPNNSWIGDTLTKHRIKVFELDQPLDPFRNYSSDFDPTGMYDPLNPIGEKVFQTKTMRGDNYSKSDSIWSQANYIDTISIEISDELGDRIFTADSAIITDPYAFKQFFKGIYFTSEKEDHSSDIGSLIQLNYRGISQELVLYYKRINYDETTNEIVDTSFLTRKFPINIEDVKVNRYAHDYTNSEIVFGDTNTDKLYVQPMAGSACKYNIEPTFIEYWEDKLPEKDNEGNIIITDTVYSIAGSTLSFYIDTALTDYRDYSVPQSIEIFAKDDNGDFVTPFFENEYGQTVQAYSAGTLNYDITEDGVVYPSKYTFTLTNGFFEEFINPQIPSNIDRANYNELYIVPANSSSTFNRVIIHSAAIEAYPNDETVKPVSKSVKYVKFF